MNAGVAGQIGLAQSVIIRNELRKQPSNFAQNRSAARRDARRIAETRGFAGAALEAGQSAYRTSDTSSSSNGIRE